MKKKNEVFTNGESFKCGCGLKPAMIFLAPLDMNPWTAIIKCHCGAEYQVEIGNDGKRTIQRTDKPEAE